jgi:hypothetical protein
MKSFVSELLGVIDFALSVFALVSTCGMSSLGHCIDAILFSHIALGILCLFSKILSWRVAIGTKGEKILVEYRYARVMTSTQDSHITRLLLLQTPFTTF